MAGIDQRVARDFAVDALQALHDLPFIAAGQVRPPPGPVKEGIAGNKGLLLFRIENTASLGMPGSMHDAPGRAVFGKEFVTFGNQVSCRAEVADKGQEFQKTHSGKLLRLPLSPLFADAGYIVCMDVDFHGRVAAFQERNAGHMVKVSVRQNNRHRLELLLPQAAVYELLVMRKITAGGVNDKNLPAGRFPRDNLCPSWGSPQGNQQAVRTEWPRVEQRYQYAAPVPKWDVTWPSSVVVAYWSAMPEESPEDWRAAKALCSSLIRADSLVSETP